jgi:hypothetical protein
MNDVTPDDCKPKFRDYGGHAFPRPHSDDQQDAGVDAQYGNEYFDQEGMYLRDYFAAKALTVIHTNPYSGGPNQLAKVAYEIADAMLAERVKP